MKGPNRRAQRRDANEPEIIAALEAVGASVDQAGPLDLVVGYRGQTTIAEVKDGDKPPSATKLTEAEAGFLSRHKGRAVVWYTVADALDCIVGAHKYEGA